MLTIEVSINGIPVTVMNATNRGFGDLHGKTHLYEYQSCTFPIDQRGDPVTSHGFITHIRSQGISKLVSLLMAQIIPKEQI